LLGIPLGLLLLKTVPEAAVKTILTVIVIAFSIYCMAGCRTLKLADQSSITTSQKGF
jgi:uncharacterized membrane protein YfcA